MKPKVEPEGVEWMLTDLLKRGYLSEKQVSEMRRFWNLPEVVE